MTNTPGVITSPEFPENYPEDLDLTTHVTVEKGKIIRLEFNVFAVYPGYGGSTCLYNFVRITDGDGTTLMGNRCGYSDPPVIMTKTNKVDVYFRSIDAPRKGRTRRWRLSWTTVEGGNCYHYIISVSELTTKN